MNKLDLIEIRPYRLEDKNFIFSTYLRGLYYGNTMLHETPKDLFMAHFHKFLETTISKTTNWIRIACLKEEPDVILGYSILGLGGKSLHWIFVKSAWRNIGIAKMLVPESVETVTHMTKVGLSIFKKKQKLIYNPF